MTRRQMRRAVLAYADDWAPRLSLAAWSLRVYFERPPERQQSARELWDSADAISVRHGRRMSADLYFNLDNLAAHKTDDLELEEIAVHELVHVVGVSPESQVNALARALVGARRNG